MVKTVDNQLTFEAGSETLSRTNLGQFQSGTAINLERALAVGQRMGGHYVSGHIDALATVDERNDDGQWAEFWFKTTPELTRQMASKGSVAVDGVSLTLVGVEAERFSVALIPHTLDATTLGDRHVGDQVNIETDLLAKYVQQAIESTKVMAKVNKQTVSYLSRRFAEVGLNSQQATRSKLLDRHEPAQHTGAKCSAKRERRRA